MKKIFIFGAIFSSFLLASDSLLRINCDENTINTKVFINNEYKGQCSSDFAPIDLFLKSGNVNIYAHKKLGEDKEQTFSTSIYLRPNAPSRLSLSLSNPKLTKKAKERYFQIDLRNAQEGNIDAIKKIITKYKKGDGTYKNWEEARRWQNVLDAKEDIRKANNGNLKAIDALVSRYEYGNGVEVNFKESNYWKRKARKIREENKIRDIKLQRKAKINKLKKELNKISYTKNLRQVDSMIAKGAKKGSLESTFAITISPALTTAMALLDISSTPKRMSEKREIEKKIESHAASWAKPGSLMSEYHNSK